MILKEVCFLWSQGNRAYTEDGFILQSRFMTKLRFLYSTSHYSIFCSLYSTEQEGTLYYTVQYIIVDCKAGLDNVRVHTIVHILIDDFFRKVSKRIRIISSNTLSDRLFNFSTCSVQLLQRTNWWTGQTVSLLLTYPLAFVSR